MKRSPCSLSLALALTLLACGEDLVPPEPPPDRDPTANGAWVGHFGPVTVRYSLTEAGGSITGTMEFVALDIVEGSAPVEGSRTGLRIELRAGGPAFVSLILGAQITGRTTFSGTQSGSEIQGYFDFRGTGTDPATGPFAVEIQPPAMPLTLVRVR